MRVPSLGQAQLTPQEYQERNSVVNRQNHCRVAGWCLSGSMAGNSVDPTRWGQLDSIRSLRFVGFVGHRERGETLRDGTQAKIRIRADSSELPLRPPSAREPQLFRDFHGSPTAGDVFRLHFGRCGRAETYKLPNAVPAS